MEMSKVYDKAFKVGVGINILVFVILNFASCIIAYSEFYSRENSKSLRLSGKGYKWGFPFEMYHNFYGYPNDIGLDLFGVIGNTFAVAISSFVIGLVLQSVWAERTSLSGK